jgi:hypothetical protein
MGPSRERIAGLACAAGILVGMLLGSTPSMAQSQASSEDRAACTPDVFRLCSSEIPNVERIVACLQKDKARLSEKCRAVFNRPSTAVASQSATRSLRPSTAGGWCKFDQNAQGGVEQMWTSWCK